MVCFFGYFNKDRIIYIHPWNLSWILKNISPNWVRKLIWPIHLHDLWVPAVDFPGVYTESTEDSLGTGRTAAQAHRPPATRPSRQCAAQRIDSHQHTELPWWSSVRRRQPYGWLGWYGLISNQKFGENPPVEGTVGGWQYRNVLWWPILLGVYAGYTYWFPAIHHAYLNEACPCKEGAKNIAGGHQQGMIWKTGSISEWFGGVCINVWISGVGFPTISSLHLAILSNTAATAHHRCLHQQWSMQCLERRS